MLKKLQNVNGESVSATWLSWQREYGTQLECQSRKQAIFGATRLTAVAQEQIYVKGKHKISCDRSTGSCICLLCVSVIFCRQGHIHDPVLLSQDGNYTCFINPLNPELNPICYLLALLAHHFLHVSRIRVKSLTLRLLMSYIYIYIYIYIWSAYS